MTCAELLVIFCTLFKIIMLLFGAVGHFELFPLFVKMLHFRSLTAQYK